MAEIEALPLVTRADLECISWHKHDCLTEGMVIGRLMRLCTNLEWNAENIEFNTHLFVDVHNLLYEMSKSDEIRFHGEWIERLW